MALFSDLTTFPLRNAMDDAAGGGADDDDEDEDVEVVDEEAPFDFLCFKLFDSD